MAKTERRGQGRTASADIERTGTMEATPKVESFDERKPEPKIQFTAEMEELLETPFYSLHKAVPQFQQERISMDPRHWVVQWFFPNAKGGPIYVDYPRSKADFEICKKKAAIMERLKRTYLLFRPDDQHKLMKAKDVISSDGADFDTGDAVF